MADSTDGETQTEKPLEKLTRKELAAKLFDAREELQGRERQIQIQAEDLARLRKMLDRAEANIDDLRKGSKQSVEDLRERCDVLQRERDQTCKRADHYHGALVTMVDPEIMNRLDNAIGFVCD